MSVRTKVDTVSGRTYFIDGVKRIVNNGEYWILYGWIFKKAAFREAEVVSIYPIKTNTMKATGGSY